MASHQESRAKERISTVLIAAPLCILLISSANTALGCPLPADDGSRREVIRPRSGASEQTQRLLEQDLLRVGSLSRLAAGPPPAGVEAPEQVDLGIFRPSGRVNPDGSETWVPRGDSILAGRVEVDVDEDGRVVRQKVLRPLRASDIVQAFSGSPDAEGAAARAPAGENEAAGAAEPGLADSRRGEWR